MSRLYTSLSLLILGIAFTLLFTVKSDVKSIPGIANPEAHQVESIVIPGVPYSNVLTNYINIGIRDQAGAINCLVVSRTDSNLILAGSQNGGVWISHNAAHSWSPVNDTARSLCVQSIAQNFFRPNEFYYSTGVDIRENGFLLYDVYRSVDYGQTFSIVTPTTYPSFGRVNKIVPSPIDANTLYVIHSNSSYNIGEVYRTTDNCNTFQLVYSASYAIDDLIVLPDGTVEIGYRHSIWRSNSGNPGTFVQSTGINATGYDTRLAFCQSRPDIQYYTVYLYGGYDFYKSLDTGRTWNYLTTSAYGHRIQVKPDNPDFVIAGSITTKVSLDGGLNWQSAIVGHDLRSFNFDPHRPGKVYVTSDFGIATIEVDPVTATSFNQQYKFDTLLYSQEAYAGDYVATGLQTIQGYQDLGSRFIQNMTLSRYMLSGDGGFGFISKQNPDIGYFSAQYGDMYRSDHMTTTNMNIVAILNQLDTTHDGNVDEGTMFTHPFIMNNANDSQLYFPTFTRLWRSTDRGTNWAPISRPYGNQMADVTIACNHKPNPIVYWTNSDSVFVIANAATASPYSEFGKPIPFDPWRCYTDPSHDSALYILNRSYISRISYCENVFTSNVWQDIPLTMLSGLTIKCMAVDPTNNQIIFVGTKEGGMYVTLDRGLTWTKELGLPNVQITEIKIRESDRKVFIFTYGRGTWAADFASSVSVAENKISNVSVFPNPFRDQFAIEFNSEVNAIVELTDLQGKQCAKKTVSGKKVLINTNDLAPGIYIVSVHSGNELIYQTKIAKLTD